MTPTLLFPAGLLALVGLIAPLAIHIARRSEQQTVDFAALRWLRQKPKPRSRLRLDEWLLLALRLILLALAALWLAAPALIGWADERPYVAVAPGARFDASGFGEARVRWLAPGFPDIKKGRPDQPAPLASLIRELDATLPATTPLTIVLPSMIDGADAERLRLSRRVTWRVTAGAMQGRPAASPPKPPRVAIRYDAAHRDAARYLRAAASSWEGAGRVDEAMADAPLPPQDHILLWLVGGTVPEAVIGWTQRGGALVVASDAVLTKAEPGVVIWRDAAGKALARAMPTGRGRLIQFERAVTPAAMPEVLEPDFPDQWRAVLQPPATPSRVLARDYAPASGAQPAMPVPDSLRPWIALLIILVLGAERWFATSARRGAAP